MMWSRAEKTKKIEWIEDNLFIIISDGENAATVCLLLFLFLLPLIEIYDLIERDWL